jgi:hypothetical protein
METHRRGDARPLAEAYFERHERVAREFEQLLGRGHGSPPHAILRGSAERRRGSNPRQGIYLVHATPDVA